MIRNRTNRTRRGFSLIELLAVMAILAVLTALVVGVLVSVRGSAASRVTEETLSKLQPALDQQRMMVMDKCRKDRTSKTSEFTALAVFCGGDDDRAEALWLYMQMRREFPQTVAEVAAFTMPGSGVVVQPRSTFASAAGAASALADQQAAILLFLNLSEKSGGGVGIQADTISQGDIQVGANKFRVFRDAQGTHIAFFRHAQNVELDGAQYVPSGGFKDPLDPRGKLAGTWANKGVAQAALGITFDGRNKVLTAVSAGPNKLFDTVANSLTSDDVFSYRVKKQGQRAD